MIAARDRLHWVIVLVLVAGAGCRCDAFDGSAAVEPEDAAPPWDVAPPAQPARSDMVWIPDGVLVAGTQPGRVPRIADEELAGMRIEMKGFFIDRYNHPAEPGSIPLTSLTRDEARAICKEQGKRLCTELEWERACKGPDNHTYEYGDTYDANACATGESDSLAPNGVNARCESGFGVRDMHGSSWNWTASAWERGVDRELIAVRGGNGADGELTSRCAHGRGMEPNARDKTIGVRCCQGEPNDARVALKVERGEELEFRVLERELGALLDTQVPEVITRAVAGRGPEARFRVQRLWIWRPIGNEELLIGGGCAHPGGRDLCGAVVVRRDGKTVKRLAFIASDWWIPTVGDAQARRVYVYGGDIGGAYRKGVEYAWGRVIEGDKYRKRRGNWEVPAPE
ncbi:MAG TPA: SUMF1/EgtB/PvdO family nonheme iron enzyme [Polyangiaceae bacterium]|nr:SUMF1/EgtB/PvdO family nonheme iron enzyme [Polyangiaceae bacterium]